jgi:hypothetical protein
MESGSWRSPVRWRASRRQGNVEGVQSVETISREKAAERGIDRQKRPILQALPLTDKRRYMSVERGQYGV